MANKVIEMFAAPVITGLVMLTASNVISRIVIPLHDENQVIQALIPELTSRDPARIDLALQLLKEMLSEDRYRKYEHIVNEKIRNAVKNQWTPDPASLPQPLPEKVDNSLLLDKFQKLRPDWKGLIDQEVEKYKQQVKKQLNEASRKEMDREDPFSKLIDLANKRLDKNDCLGAYIAFSRASEVRDNSEAAASGMTVAQNCISSEQKEAFFEAVHEHNERLRTKAMIKMHEENRRESMQTQKAEERIESFIQKEQVKRKLKAEKKSE